MCDTLIRSAFLPPPTAGGGRGSNAGTMGGFATPRQTNNEMYD